MLICVCHSHGKLCRGLLDENKQCELHVLCRCAYLSITGQRHGAWRERRQRAMIPSALVSVNEPFPAKWINWLIVTSSVVAVGETIPPWPRMRRAVIQQSSFSSTQGIWGIYNGRGRNSCSVQTWLLQCSLGRSSSQFHPTSTINPKRCCKINL